MAVAKEQIRQIILQNSPIYPFVFMDGIHYKVQEDGRILSRAVSYNWNPSNMSRKVKESYLRKIKIMPKE